MWCRECHREVDAKAAGAACPVCGRALVASSRQTDDIRRAYEILERWQSSDLFERINTTAPLATLKQQDRAPLLNIPLGPRTAVPEVRDADSFVTAGTRQADLTGPAPLSVHEETSGRGISAASEQHARPVEGVDPAGVEPARIKSEEVRAAPRIEMARNRITLETVQAASLTADQMLWDLVVKPGPLLAAAAPALDEAQPLNGADLKVPELLVAGVSESPMSRAAAEAEQTKRNQVTAADSRQRENQQENQPENHNAALDLTSHAELDEVMTQVAADSAPDPYLSDANISCSAKDEQIAGGTADVTGTESHPADSAESTVFLQAALSAPVSAATVREESAGLQDLSAETANNSKQSTVGTTKKTQRAAIRRPPLHRRFQMERPVPEHSAGSETVTRKLRLDQTGGSSDAPQAKEPVTSLPSSVAPETRIVSNSPKPGRRYRIDSAESVDDITETAGSRSRTHGRPRHRYIDEAHETALRGPHFEVSAPRRSNLTSMTGQFLAYMGVLGLTIGTAMVIYGHFGGYSEYTPTGWLVTTVAQMLLFLGVINLVSGGIEQNNEEVSRRINTLGEQLLRIEQVTSEVARGPKIPAHRYAEDAVPEEAEESRQTVS